jgi:ATP-dependent exoDNAse (exonuclease V) alpha subunit
LAELICKTDIIIWDEAPMLHRHNHEAVDCTLCDIRNCDRPFGGLTVVFGGDFKQILPVIVKGSRGQIVGASLCRSRLWGSIEVLKLTENMRLNTMHETEKNFAAWQLEMGRGQHTDESDFINLPDDFKCAENTVQSLINTIYPNIHLNHPDKYFAERTILCSKNDDVDDVNTTILNQFPGAVKVYHGSDNVVDSGEDGPLLYPAEYLNTINCSGLPLAKLQVKKGCPIMILRNLNASEGLCNGSRGIVTRMGNRVLEVWLLTGEQAGQKVFIPRIGIVPTDTQVPFKFCRRQFPVRISFGMSINKSQGQSVLHVGLNLVNSVFAHGQLYVAVSRVTSFYNIKVILDEEVEGMKTKNIVYPEVIID